jgi:hypothetical protein
VIMAMDILVHTKATEAEIKKIFNSQLDKWEGKMYSERSKKL